MPPPSGRNVGDSAPGNSRSAGSRRECAESPGSTTHREHPQAAAEVTIPEACDVPPAARPHGRPRRGDGRRRPPGDCSIAGPGRAGSCESRRTSSSRMLLYSSRAARMRPQGGRREQLHAGQRGLVGPPPGALAGRAGSWTAWPSVPGGPGPLADPQPVQVRRRAGRRPVSGAGSSPTSRMKLVSWKARPSWRAGLAGRAGSADSSTGSIMRCADYARGPVHGPGSTR